MADDTPRRTRRAARTPAPATDAVPASAAPVGPNSLLASAKVLTQAKKGAIPRPLSWQEEAWSYYDSIGELRFACAWYANALSRCKITLATKGAPGDDPTPLEENDPRLAMLDDLGSDEGRAQLLAGFAPHLVVPGIGYLVGIDEVTNGETTAREWRVLSIDEIRANSGKFQSRDEAGKWSDLPPDTLPVKVWRPHARFHWQPDSPVRALIPILRELSLLSAHIDASATSRLAGAGILLMAKEITFPVKPENAGKEDPFTAELMDAMLTPIGDRDSASAVVPYVVQVPGEFVDKIKHLTFSTPFDETAIKLREEARTRFASGMDMPAAVILGLDKSNHWTAWQIGEEAIKLHVIPMLETICQGLTVGWLKPTQAAQPGESPASIAAPGGDDELVVWYDASSLQVRPDKSQDALALYGLDAIGIAALLRETGFDATDAPSPEDLQRSLLVSIVKAQPTLFPIIAPMLGIKLTIDPNAEPWPSGGPAAGGAADGEPADVPADGPPSTQDAPPPAPDDNLPASSAPHSDGALVEACDGLVFRAMERAGNRLRNLGRRVEGMDLAGVAPEAAHTIVDPTCLSDLDGLLDGAWTRVPSIADRHGIDGAALTTALDRYCRSLLATQLPHTYDGLAEALGADEPGPAPTPVPA